MLAGVETAVDSAGKLSLDVPFEQKALGLNNNAPPLIHSFGKS
jgi:hypothetical protein